MVGSGKSVLVDERLGTRLEDEHSIKNNTKGKTFSCLYLEDYSTTYTYCCYISFLLLYYFSNIVGPYQAHVPGEPKVAEFEHVRAGVDEQVFGFDVAVGDRCRMTPVDGFAELIHVALD